MTFSIVIMLDRGYFPPTPVHEASKESTEKTAGLDGTDEELIDVLIAISVVAKRLARKLQNEQKGECQHEQNE